MKKSIKKKVWIRRVIQVFFFVLVGLIAYNHTLAESGRGIPLLSSASLHAICPFGGVVSIYHFITTGTFVKKIHESALVLMGISIFMAVLFGPILCGWVCPLGSIQEWFGRLGKKVFKKKYNRFIPSQVDKYLRFLRYGVLAWVIYMTATSGYLIFQDLDPFYALFNFWSSEVSIIGIIVLLITLGLSLFIDRPWCKYACPYGAFLGIFNTFRVFQIKRNPNTCISCKVCDNSCPMNIEVSNTSLVRNHQCISCLKCTSEESCPIENTVEITTNRKEQEASKSEN